MSGHIHHHPHRVTYSECTLGDHVYHARYLDILEAARGECMRALGLSFRDLQGQGLAFPILECRLRYLQLARYDEVLHVETRLTEASRVRLNFSYRVTNESGRPILEGETLHAATSLEGKPKRLPKELMARLIEFQTPAASECQAQP